MKFKTIKLTIIPLYYYLDDDTGLPQFFIVCDEYFCTIKIATKNIGQDGGLIPFQDLQSTQDYLDFLLDKTNHSHCEKILILFKKETEL